MLIYVSLLKLPQQQQDFEAVYLRYRQLMYRRAYKILGNPQDAEDAVHEAFLAIAKNFHKISSEECHKIKWYVVTIVEHKAIDIYRKKQRQPHTGLVEALDAVHEDRYTDNRLANCLLRLPEQYRTVLLLKYAYGLSNREIARTLNVSQNNVSKRIERGKAALRVLCEEEELL